MGPPAPFREELRDRKNGIVRISQTSTASRANFTHHPGRPGVNQGSGSGMQQLFEGEGLKVFSTMRISKGHPEGCFSLPIPNYPGGLRNISKHACAEHASVSLHGIDHDVLLSVRDDGIGFDWAEAKGNPRSGVLEYARTGKAYPGELSIKSEPEKGTV